MPDINTYALSIALRLESNAEVVLDDVSVRLDRINEQIQQIGGVYDTALGGAAARTAEATEQIATSMDEVRSSLDQSWPVLEDIGELHEERRDNLEEELEQVEQIRDVQEEIRDHIDDIVAATPRITRGFFEVFLGIEAIKAAFAEFLELEEQFITANYRLYGSQEQIVGQVNAISDQYDVLRGTAHDAMRALAISLRVPREELGKYVAQVAMFERVTSASIDITSEWIRKMTLAGWSARDTEASLRKMMLMMRAAGFTTEQVNKILSREIDQSAKLWFAFGTQGMTSIQNVKRELLALTRAHHGDTEALQELLDASTSEYGAMGLLTQRAQKYGEQLAAVAAHERAGAELKWGLYDVITELRNRYGDLSGITREHLVDMAQSDAALRAYGGLFATHGDAIAKVAQSWQDFETPEEFEAAIRAVAEANKPMELFAEAMNTVRAEWDRALRPLFNAWINLMIALKPVMLFIVDVVGLLADVLGFLINIIAAVINPIAFFKRQLDGVANTGEQVVGFFKRLGSGIVNFAKALPGIIFGVAVLIGLYHGLRLISRLFIDWVNQMRPANLRALAMAFLAIGASALMMATALAIVASLGWKAAGALIVLAAAVAGMVVTITLLANVAANATVPLAELAGVMLAFGAAALMIAGSLWVVAEAMKTMVDLGWALVGALIGVAAVVAVFTGALLLFGAAAAPAAPVILAVGAAFLMMGAAIWLAAKAFEVIVESFGKLGESAMQVVSNAGALFTAVGIISAALLALAVVGALTAIPLLALGVALIVVGAAALMIAKAFEAVAEVIKVFADIDNVKDAIIGMSTAIAATMFTMAGIAVVLAPVLPLMLMAAGVLLAIGAAAWLTAKALDIMAGAFEKFADLEMVLTGLAGMAIALVGLAGVALLIAPAIPIMIAMGVAMLAIGAGAWLMAQAMSALVGAIQEFAAVEMGEILEAGWNLLVFGTTMAVAAAAILIGSLLMIPAALALTAAMLGLGIALWFVPVGRIAEVGAAFEVLGRGVGALATALGQMLEIAEAADTFGEIASVLSSALDEIEEEAERANAIADSFTRLNEAIATVLAGPPEAVYGDVAAALRDQLDSIEEQAARAEAIYTPIEGIAEQAELAAALTGEPAPEGFAEPVGGALPPEGGEDYRETSNFINLRRQTALLEKIEKAATGTLLGKAVDGLLGLPGNLIESVRDLMQGGEQPAGGLGPPAAGIGVGEGP